jgi:hypothetical protein
MASKMVKVAMHKSSRVALRTKVTMDSDDVAAWSDIQQRSLFGSASRGVSTTKKVDGLRKGNCSISGRATRMRRVAIVLVRRRMRIRLKSLNKTKHCRILPNGTIGSCLRLTKKAIHQSK